MTTFPFHLCLRLLTHWLIGLTLSLNRLFQLFTTAFLSMWCHIGLSIDDSNICWWNCDTNGGNAMALGSNMITNQWKWTPEIIRNRIMVVRWSSDNLRHKTCESEPQHNTTQKGSNMSANPEDNFDQWDWFFFDNPEKNVWWVSWLMNKRI